MKNTSHGLNLECFIIPRRGFSLAVSVPDPTIQLSFNRDCVSVERRAGEAAGGPSAPLRALLPPLPALCRLCPPSLFRAAPCLAARPASHQASALDNPPRMFSVSQQSVVLENNVQKDSSRDLVSFLVQILQFLAVNPPQLSPAIVAHQQRSCRQTSYYCFIPRGFFYQCYSDLQTFWRHWNWVFGVTWLPL